MKNKKRMFSVLVGFIVVVLVACLVSLPFAIAATNIAQGKAATTDSAQSANPVGNGNDGSTTTRWCAANGNTGHWWQVDLGSSQAMSGSEVMWEKSGVVYKYKVEVSTDNASWSLKVDKTSNTSTAQTQTDNFTATARYVRITITGLSTSPVAWASFYEFRVFGATTTTPTPTSRQNTPTPSAATTPTPTSVSTSVYKFDFGGGSAQSGYTKVSATLAYSSSRGYGFNTPANMANVSSSGSGINADAVQFKVFGTTSTNTFNVDLSVGLYQIKVILGNCVRSSVAAEGVFQIMNMTGTNAVDTIQIPVTDGQLNLLVTDGKAGEAHTLSALEITRLSTSPAMQKTIWLGGDSTVCNYYPLSNTNNTIQTGWGQMLSSYIPSSRYQIRNMATGGQIARGFLNDGQFTAIMKYLKAGDILILQFGINDVASKNTTTAAQFTEYMGSMVNQAKAKGATVVLNTPQGRASNWSGSTHTCLDASYRPQTVALATSTNTPLVDLCVLSSAYYTSIGQTATYALYMADYLHLNRAGALQLARLEYEELTRKNLLQ